MNDRPDQAHVPESRDQPDDPELDAGDFAAWIAGFHAGWRAERDADVPCAGCTACCRSGQFVHIGPDEVDTLAHVPAELLVTAPGWPPGHQVLGYDRRGHCPMLVADRCSIYAHRPRACRAYDCRVFTAAGIAPDRDDPAKAPIARRTRQWRFRFSSPADRERLAAVRAAAADVQQRPEVRSPGASVPNAAQTAVMAIDIHDAYMERAATGAPSVCAPDPDAVRVDVRSRPAAPEPA